MIGRVTLFIIILLTIATMLANFSRIAGNSSIEAYLYDYVGIYAEKAAMEGVISSDDHLRMKNHLQSMGNYEIYMKYSRRIAQGLYQIILEADEITDRAFGKGDIINVIVTKHGMVLFNRSAYILVNMQEYTMGYDVIRQISYMTVPVQVRNRGQTSYIMYESIFNPAYGDDEIEKPFNEGYIREYSRYVRRDEYDGEELMYISFTEN